MEEASIANEKKWPADPYKGLTFYDTKDLALYAGREDDTDRMTSTIGSGTTRIVLLHGMTGCGECRAESIPEQATNEAWHQP